MQTTNDCYASVEERRLSLKNLIKRILYPRFIKYRLDHEYSQCISLIIIRGICLAAFIGLFGNVTPCAIRCGSFTGHNSRCFLYD